MMSAIGRIRSILLILIILISVDTFAYEVKVCTFNIRYDSGIDGNNGWDYRKSILARNLNKESCDIICLQEVLHNQFVYLTEKLDKYGVVGKGRNDGQTKGEYAPIFFRRKRFELLKSGMFWLSETPDVAGSIGWDAKQPRIVTWAILKKRGSENKLLILNTHLDDIGKLSRQKSVRQILDWLKNYSEPIILVGDFNDTPDSQLYKTLVGCQNSLLDANSHANRRLGIDYTFHDFGRIKVEQRKKIDYIFVTGPQKIKRVEIPKEMTNDGIFLSDHNPLFATLKY